MGGLVLSVLFIGSNILAVTTAVPTAKSKRASAHSTDVSFASGFRQACAKGCEYAYLACRIGAVVWHLDSVRRADKELKDRIAHAVGAIDMAQDMRNTGKSISAIIDPAGSITGRKWGRTRRICRYVYNSYKFAVMNKSAFAVHGWLMMVINEPALRVKNALLMPLLVASTVSLWKSLWRGNKEQGDTTVECSSARVGNSIVPSKTLVAEDNVKELSLEVHD